VSDLYDLTQTLSPDAPHSSSLPSPAVETLSDIHEDGSNAQRWSVPTHVGTHVDAPYHFLADGRTIDEIPVDRFTGAAVVLDLAREEAGEIPLADVEEAAGAVGGIGDADIVCVRTGWGEKFDDEYAYRRYPWLAADIAEWLLEHDVKLLAVDTISPDRPRATRPDEWDEYPHHYTLLGAGTLIAEHLYLEAVAGERVELFGFPAKLGGGDGAPVRFVARA
jgi:kynurenine formamidase